MLTPGSTFGVYLVGACIGEGGMARVYQAEHAGLRRQVALKVLTDGFAKYPDGRERFLREARIAAAIKHPNVVNIFDVGVQDEIPYLVMELLEGQDLERLLETRGALDEALIIDIMIPVLAGLIAVHDAGIVHRDLKPGNIFLAKGRYNDIEPKLLDFGISKAVGLDQMKLTANRAVMGTPFYVSPEGLQGGEMTQRSDQYSLGVLMYECATGLTPFTASTFAELSNLITAGQYTPATTHKPELSKRMVRIIERAMSLEPEGRFRDLREMGRELLGLAGQRTRITWGLSFGDVRSHSDLQHEPTPTGPAVRASSDRPAPLPPPARKRRPAAMLVFTLAPLLLLATGVFAWMSERHMFDRGSHQLAATPTSMSGLSETNMDHAPIEIISRPLMPERAEAPPPAPQEPPDRPARPASAPPPAEKPAGDKRFVPSIREMRAGRAAGDQSVVRRTGRPAAQGAKRAGGATTAADVDPEWALPRTDSKSSDVVGPNEAPIFD